MPTLIFLNSSGILVDRIIGFYNAEDYLDKITNIFNGVDTFLSLKNDYISGHKNIKVLSKLASKCEENFDLELCTNVYSDITLINEELVDSKVLFKSRLFFAKRNLDNNDNSSILELIKKTDDLESLKDAYRTLINYYKKNNQPKNEASIYKTFSDKINTDSDVLNGYAWRMGELERDLDKALSAGQRALVIEQIPNRKSAMYDTVAEVFWKLGQPDSAIWYIDRAIELNESKISYYVNQKQKFMGR